MPEVVFPTVIVQDRMGTQQTSQINVSLKEAMLNRANGFSNLYFISCAGRGALKYSQLPRKVLCVPSSLMLLLLSIRDSW